MDQFLIKTHWYLGIQTAIWISVIFELYGFDHIADSYLF